MRKGDYADWLCALQKRLAVPRLKDAARITQHHIHKGGYAPRLPGGGTCQAFISFVSENKSSLFGCCL